MSHGARIANHSVVGFWQLRFADLCVRLPAADMPMADFPKDGIDVRAERLLLYDYGCGMYSSVLIRVREWLAGRLHVPPFVIAWACTTKYLVDLFHFGKKSPSGGHRGSVCRKCTNPHLHPICMHDDCNSQACEQGFKKWNRLQAGAFKLTRLNFDFDLYAFAQLTNRAKYMGMPSARQW